MSHAFRQCITTIQEQGVHAQVPSDCIEYSTHVQVVHTWGQYALWTFVSGSTNSLMLPVLASNLRV